MAGRLGGQTPGPGGRQLDPRLVGSSAGFPVPDGPDPVGVAGGGRRRIGVFRGGISRVGHQDGQFAPVLRPHYLVAGYRTGVLYGSVPGQDNAPVRQFGGQAGGGLRVRRHGFLRRHCRSRICVHRQVRRGPAHSLRADGMDPVHVEAFRLHRVVGVGGVPADRVPGDGNEPSRAVRRRFPPQYPVSGDAVVLRVGPVERYGVMGRRARRPPRSCRRQLHPRLVGICAPLHAAYGSDPVGVAFAGPTGRGVGVGGGGIPRIRHQDGQLTLATGAEYLVARDRTGILGGSLPSQDDASAAKSGGKPAGGRRRRVRELNHRLAGGLAPFPVADGLHPIGIALPRGVGGGVGVGGGGAAGVCHQGARRILSPGPQHLVARDRTGVLGGSVPA